MSQFHPTNMTIEPPPAPDYLAGAVLQGLSRPIGGRLSWGLVKSFVWGVVSFGVLPILAWARAFRAFATAEQQQFLHLAQWVRLNSNHPRAVQLEADASEIRPRAWLTWLAVLATLATAGVIYYLIDQSRQAPWDALMAGTYGHNRAVLLDHRIRHFLDSRTIFQVWFYGLTAAYLCQFLQIHLHAQDVKRFVAEFSGIAEAEGINRVKADSLGTTMRPLWIAAGFGMIALGAPWGVMAMLAGAAQRRYITWTSRNTRSDVAHRLRAMMMRRRPAAGAVPVSVYQRDRCAEPRCRSEMPRGVNFCPRCGLRQKAQVHRVA